MHVLGLSCLSVCLLACLPVGMEQRNSHTTYCFEISSRQAGERAVLCFIDYVFHKIVSESSNWVERSAILYPPSVMDAI
jgi:hypothetical protein